MASLPCLFLAEGGQVKPGQARPSCLPSSRAQAAQGHSGRPLARGQGAPLSGLQVGGVLAFSPLPRPLLAARAGGGRPLAKAAFPGLTTTSDTSGTMLHCILQPLADRRQHRPYLQRHRRTAHPQPCAPREQPPEVPARGQGLQKYPLSAETPGAPPGPLGGDDPGRLHRPPPGGLGGGTLTSTQR